MISRSEIFTTFELGNTFATSGSNTTTLVPCAKRRAYLPRSLCEKSYSFWISLPADLFDAFFITFAFSAAGTSRANDADIIASIGMNDNYWAEVPALPGCVSQGETLDDVRTNGAGGYA